MKISSNLFNLSKNITLRLGTHNSHSHTYSLTINSFKNLNHVQVTLMKSLEHLKKRLNETEEAKLTSDKTIGHIKVKSLFIYN